MPKKLDFSRLSNKEFALKLHEWHGGQETGTYALASSLLAHATSRDREGGQYIPQEVAVERAIAELREIQGHEAQEECDALIQEIQRRYTHLSQDLDEFTKAYVDAALWSSTEGLTDTALNEHYTLADLAPETLEIIRQDCAKFQTENKADIESGCERTGKPGCQWDDYGQAGHDFWSTRCGHGSGFWDGDWSEEAGDRLTEASQKFGECWLYVGDDQKIYFM